MPIDVFSRSPNQPSQYEVLRAAQTIPADRLDLTPQVVDRQFESMVAADPELQALDAAAASTQAQEIAQATNAYNIPGRQPEVATSQFDAIVAQPDMQQLAIQAEAAIQPNAYRIPTQAEASTIDVPASPEVRRYTAEQAKIEALNAGDAIMRVRREALALADSQR